MKSILYISILSVSTFLLMSCNSNTESITERKEQNTMNVLSIDNRKLNFSVEYQYKGILIKPILKKDTITLVVNYEKRLEDIVKNNTVQIVPNVRNCQIKKINNFTFWILFDKEYKEPILKWTMYIIPERNTIFSISENKYYNFSERVFIAEKRNEILLSEDYLQEEKKKIDQTKKDIDKVMEMSKKNDFNRKPLKKGSYRWSDREKQE